MHIVRYATPSLYTFELVVVLGVWALVPALWRAGDRRPLAVYTIAGLYSSAFELLAQGSGVRAIADARLFGLVPVGYPLLPFLLASSRAASCSSPASRSCAACARVIAVACASASAWPSACWHSSSPARCSCAPSSPPIRRR